MKQPAPTVQQINLIMAYASVSEPTARKFFRGNEPMRPAMIQRIVAALKELGLMSLYPKGSR